MEFSSDIVIKNKKRKKLADFLVDKHEIFKNYVVLFVCCCALGIALEKQTEDVKDDDYVINLPRNVIDKKIYIEKLEFLFASYMLRQNAYSSSERLEFVYKNSKDNDNTKINILRKFANTGAYYLYDALPNIEDESSCIDRVPELFQKEIERLVNFDLEEEYMDE